MIIHAGTKDYSYPLDPRDVCVVMAYTEEPDPPGSLEFLELASHVMHEHDLSMPNTVQEALEVFAVLTTIIGNEIETYR